MKFKAIRSVAPVLAALVLVCSACSKAPAPPPQKGTDAERAVADVRAAQEQLGKALTQLAKVSRPVTDPDVLVRELGIQPERAAAMTAGNGPAFTFDATAAVIVCTGNTCECHGKDECSYTFSDICKDATLPASCTDAPDEVRVCTCQWKVDR